jgi:hypothetical protein
LPLPIHLVQRLLDLNVCLFPSAVTHEKAKVAAQSAIIKHTFIACILGCTYYGSGR